MCLLKRVLPFTLTLIIGLLSVSYIPSLKIFAGKPRYAIFRHKMASVKIISVPDIIIPNANRRFPQGYSVAIRLEALLGADGKVSEIKPVPMLPYGITEASLDPEERSQISPFILNGKLVPNLPDGFSEAAIDAVSHIKFVPATFNEQAMPVRITIHSEWGYAPSPDFICADCPNAHTVIMQDGVVKWETGHVLEGTSDISN